MSSYYTNQFSRHQELGPPSWVYGPFPQEVGFRMEHLQLSILALESGKSCAADNLVAEMLRTLCMFSESGPGVFPERIVGCLS